MGMFGGAPTWNFPAEQSYVPRASRNWNVFAAKVVPDPQKRSEEGATSNETYETFLSGCRLPDPLGHRPWRLDAHRFDSVYRARPGTRDRCLKLGFGEGLMKVDVRNLWDSNKRRPNIYF